MSRINELMGKRKKALDEAHDFANRENFTAEDNTQYQARMGEAAELKVQIEALQAADRERQALDSAFVSPKAGAGSDGDPRAEQHAAVFNSYLRNGLEGMSADDRKILQGTFRQTQQPQGAQTIGTANKGGYTVPTGFHADVEKAELEFNGVVEAGCSIIDTENGQDIPWPTVNDTANKGRRVAEAANSTTTDVTFGQVTLKAYTYSSDLILVSNELLADSGVDLDKVIGELAGERIGRILNEEFTTGTGSSQPQGVVTGSTLGVTAAATAAVTVDELNDLMFSVGRAYRKNGTFMMGDDMLLKLNKLKDSDGRPIFSASYKDDPVDRILGKRVVTNDDIADIAAGAKTILFGDFSKYKYRQVKGVLIRRLEERFADNNEVGFLVFKRASGHLINAGTNPIKHLIQAAS